jgi:hypothetical protein
MLTTIVFGGALYLSMVWVFNLVKILIEKEEPEPAYYIRMVITIVIPILWAFLFYLLH